MLDALQMDEGLVTRSVCCNCQADDTEELSIELAQSQREQGFTFGRLLTKSA
jgi:hypothetical protein